MILKRLRLVSVLAAATFTEKVKSCDTPVSAFTCIVTAFGPVSSAEAPITLTEAALLFAVATTRTDVVPNGTEISLVPSKLPVNVTPLIFNEDKDVSADGAETITITL